MIRHWLAKVMPIVVCGVAVTMLTGGCPGSAPEDSESPETTGTTESPDSSESPDEGTNDSPILRVQAYTDTLGADGGQSAQTAPDDVDVNLTPIEYTIAFKRLVIKQVDEVSDETLVEQELFSADTIDDALIVDLVNSQATDLFDVEALSAGTYNKVDIEVFYLDMTVPTLYPGSTSHDIGYRMVFETMGVLEQRDFLLLLEPEWMEAGSTLAASVTESTWYWMDREDPDHVVPVDGATEHPTFPVLDLFANDEFWSSEHKVLEGGRIEPPLEYDPNAGAVLTIAFDVTGTFDFKDYHDETTEPDGQWEIRRDAGIHPFPPSFDCVSAELEPL